MLSEIIEHAIAAETDIALVEGPPIEADDLGSFARSRRIDVVVFSAGASEFTQERIAGLLHAIPRLGLLAIDGPADRAELHHLTPARDRITPLTRSSVVAAIRAGAALRRR
jgi:hypothetical protein